MYNNENNTIRYTVHVTQVGNIKNIFIRNNQCTEISPNYTYTSFVDVLGNSY